MSAMQVPFLDLARENEELVPQILEATERVARSGKVLYGPELEAFEREIAEWHGVPHAVGLASGTDAVEVAIRCAGASYKWQVTAMTAPATINAMEAAGVAIELVDPDATTRNAERVDLHVQLYGLATDARTSTVEDIAHSMGATVDGRIAGTMGVLGAGSAYPTKIMGALGDGGFILTSDAKRAALARDIRHYGMNEDGNVASRGQNSRLCELQAAFLRIKLKRVHGWIERRRAIAARYTAELQGRVVTPAEPDGHRGVYHVYCIEHPERDRLRTGLRERGIGTLPHYDRAIHQHSRWAPLAYGRTFPVAERIAARALSLPCYPYLRAEEQDAVIAAVKEIT